MYFKVSILAIVLLFSGCSNSVIQSTVDLNNEFEVKWGLTGSPNQLKQMSINGFSPITNVGEVYYIKPSNGLQSAVMLNETDFISSPLDFYVQRTTYKSIVKEETLFEIKNLISRLESLSTKILEEKIKELKKEAEKVHIISKIEDINKEITEASDNKVEKLEKQKSEKKVELNTKNITLEQIKEIENKFKKQIEIENAIVILEKNLEVKNISEKEKKEKTEEKKKKLDNLATIKNKIAELLEIYGKNVYQIQYDLLYDEYLKKTSKKNIFVFRWNLKSDKSANIDAINYLSLNSKAKKEKTGYLIASGVVIEKLVPNKAFIKHLESEANISNYGAIFRGHLGMVTYTLKVDHLVSFVSQKKENMFKLLASLKDIQHFTSDIKKITNVELGISLLSVSDVSTFSNFSNPYHEKITGGSLFEFKKNTIINKELSNIIKKSKTELSNIVKSKGLEKENILSELNKIKIKDEDKFTFMKNITSLKTVLNENSVMNTESPNNIKPNQTTIFSVITEATELADMYK